MLHFFRRLRNRLFASKQFGKYLGYAVGETILVIIGILIALQINNWNEERKNDKAAEALFVNIQRDIEKDIQRSDFILEQFANISIQMDKVFDFDNPITEAEYLKGANDIESGYRRPMGARALPFSITDGGYRNVINQLETIPEKYKPVVNKLTNLYSTLIPLSELYHNRLQAFVDPHLEFRSRQNWELYRLKHNRPSQEEMDYFIKSDDYKSYLIKWVQDTENMLMVSQQFRRQGMLIHKEIDSLIGLEESTFPKALLHNIEPKVFQDFEGVYGTPGDTSHREELFIRDGQIYSKLVKNGDRNVDETPTYHYRHIRDSLFALTVPPYMNWWQFYEFTEDENGNKAIELIDYDFRGPFKKLVKIEE